MQTPLLDQILSPNDLRQLSEEKLVRVAAELRAFLLESVSQTGGHLSSNLGTVELTIALHYALNTPDDRLVWDVGHQTYGHKVLTGRRAEMASLRQYQGISGFPKRSESIYDCFGTAHSSTSISAALGMAVAARDAGDPRYHIAIIGDGAMSAGMAFEALNNAGDLRDVRLLVMLNDNEMSISPPVGALSKALSRLMSGQTMHAARKAGELVLSVAPPVLDLARKVEEHVKGMVMPGTLFEEFGFKYFGPIDGHDISALLPMLRNLRQRTGPHLLHVITRKGQGYKLAEKDPVLYHGVSRFNHQAGIGQSSAPAPLTYTQVFGDWLCDMARHDDKLAAITPAMREGSGMVRFAKEFPEKYYDVGIAEQHALTFAAGLACEGRKPVVAIYSTFLQRAYDQLIHDITLQNLPVMLAIDRAGLVGADGATHHGAFDIAYLQCLPNMLIMAPANEAECRQMLNTAYYHNGPSAVRYPRGGGNGSKPADDFSQLAIGKGELLRKSSKTSGAVAILAFGSMVQTCLEVAETLDASLANMRFIKPLDEQLIITLASAHDFLVVVEESCFVGGVGGEVARLLDTRRQRPPLLRLGLPDRFIDHGTQAQLMSEAGLDATGIRQQIDGFITNNN